MTTAKVFPLIDERAMQHGSDWSGEFCEGWWITEKFHGVRAYWDGLTLWTRGGHQVSLPDSWKAALPQGLVRDGEIWAGYHATAFAEAVAAAKHGRFTPLMQFKVIDAPEASGHWEERMLAVQRRGPVVHAINGVPLTSLQHLADAYRAVHDRGGEGLVLRHPTLAYHSGRTRGLLKFKAEQYRQLIAEFPHLAESA